MNKKSYLIIIFLIAASCIFFGRIAGNHFINFDDPGYLTKNYQIQSGLNFENIKWAFTAIVVSNWHPLTLLSHMLDWSLFGNYAGGHHLVSLLWHIGTVILLFLFLYKTTNNIWPSAFAAAFFALHPLRVESVAWASERKDVLSMFFGMASIYTYAFYVEKNKISRYCLCLIFFMLSLMSKPMLVTLPFVLLLLDYWPLRRWQTQDAPLINLKPAGKLILEKIPFMVISIASSIITLWAQNKGGSIASDMGLPLTIRFSNAIFSYVAYLGKIFWPVDLAVFYPLNFFLPLWQIITSGIAILLISIAALYLIKKKPFLFVGWFWYLGTLVPVIGLVQVGKQAMADRYTYLPSIGITILLAWIIPSLLKKESTSRMLFPAAFAILAVLSFLTWKQCGYWKNGISLFKHTAQVIKMDYRDLENMGNDFTQLGHYQQQKEIQYYNEAVRFKPDDYRNYFHRGIAYSKIGQYQKAIKDFNQAIQIKPDYVESYLYRGNIYGQHGQYKLAIQDFDKVISLKPDHMTAYNNRGLAYSALGQYETAIKDYNKAIMLDKNYAVVYNNRANAHFKQGDQVSGCLDAQKACKLGICDILKAASNKGLCR
ncbi:MAG: tetratricopeptide repeat protein [Smithella sp.]|nr:tetratricopeptide repeat protein [Smithella sp.]